MAKPLRRAGSVPKVSVLLPFYNARETLPRAVASLRRQTLVKFEIIAVDDGSTDGSSDWLRQARLQNLRLIRQPRNLGLPSALNRAIGVSRGRYLARMDADDECHPERLARQAEFLDAHPEVGVCGCQVLCRSRSGSSRWRYPLGAARSRALLFLGSPVAHPAVMMRREIFSRGIRYAEDFLGGGEDWELWERIGKKWAIRNLPQILLTYHLSPGGMSRAGREKQNRDRRAVAARILRKLGLPVGEPTLKVHLEITQPPARVSAGQLLHTLRHLRMLGRKIQKKHPGIFRAFGKESLVRWFQHCRKAGPIGWPIFFLWFFPQSRKAGP